MKKEEKTSSHSNTCCDWAKDEVQFIDEQLKAVEDMSNAIVKKRFPSVDAMEFEKKRKKRRQKEMQKKKKNRTQTTAVKQGTKILHACDVDKGIIESVIRELKHATFLSHGRQPEVNIWHARTVVSPRVSN